MPPQPKCGDGICGAEENESLCPVDCVKNQCVIIEETVNTWNGQVISTPDPYNTNWYGCFDLSIKNTGTLTALSYILTIKLCSTLVSLNDLTGYQQDLVIDIISFNYKFYQSISNDIIFLNSHTYPTNRVCFDFKDGTGLGPAAIHYGVELRDQKTGCVAGTCLPSCGDNSCGTGETADNCPCDCALASCPDL